MKKLLVLLIFLGCYQFSSAQLSAGAGVSVITGNRSAFGLQGRLMYAANDDFTVSASYNYYFEKFIGNIIDVDLQYSLIESDGGFVISPMAGIRVYTKGELNTNLHLGVYSVLPINGYHIYLEPKFVISDVDAFVVSVGFRF